ncbi:sigma-70 family RNA polymerase sigma factor [Mumia zhuanghuii]|uniref:Sigma-70 family RNA polymerase sigma factor n=2 Tax=Mumia TaxID=1546255 RepID=A0ABW1QII7_9ACTN|nr:MULTISPECIES: sigma-70 family RNA polymerase sigma factor [Mumia]KAA1424760.1 sigma-70 family RNA polymerase sigma factor [Mumia zhuanghuii]
MSATTLVDRPTVDLLELEEYRHELTAFFRRRLASAAEADDALQETMIRAWRGRATYQGRASVRSWLYGIATNVCRDAWRSAARRPRPMDLGATDGAALALVGAAADPDPADAADEREDVRAAFTSVVRRLPPRQRAVLVLRDVLRWRAAEVATLLDTSVASVNSALQRARGTMRDADARDDVVGAADARLVDEYDAAFAAYDVDRLVALLRADALTAARS